MGDAIKLPPLPGDNITVMTIERVRARDLEVARVVLEAAANVCENPGPYWDWDDFTNAIRALEVSHAE